MMHSSKTIITEGAGQALKIFVIFKISIMIMYTLYFKIFIKMSPF